MSSKSQHVPIYSALVLAHFLSQLPLGRADFHASTSHMEKLLDTEAKIIRTLDMYTSEIQERLDMLLHNLNPLKLEHSKAAADVSTYLKNPINAFQLIKRLCRDWDAMAKSVDEETTIQDLVGKDVKLLLPTENDLTAAGIGLFRLQDLYDLDTRSIADGVLNGIQYDSRMSAGDCFELAHQSMQYNDLKHGSMWMREAIRRQDEQKSDKSRYRAPKKIKPMYERLCNEDYQPPPAQLAPLRCRYVTNKSDFLRIGPLKLEEANLQPYIAIYHEVIFDSEIERIINMTKSRFERALAGETEAQTHGPGKNYRIAMMRWLNDEDDPVVEKISRRIEDITGMTTATAEMLQVSNYGVGGHFKPHYDFLENDAAYLNNNRIATVLLYMSTVEQGGHTVFPFLNVTIKTLRGSAAMWMNLYASGNPDRRTMHAGCPVLVGSKWVGNKWLHELQQDTYRPCDLTPDDVDFEWRRKSHLLE